MITAGQTSATRAPFGFGQSHGVIRGNVDSLMKLVSALAAMDVEMINDGQPSTRNGKGVPLIRQPADQ